MNALERDEDANGVWRGYVDEQLATVYPALWRLIERFLYLQVPGIGAVLEWRGEQELARPAPQRMSRAALVRFVQHYERLTLRMNRELPGKAHLTGVLGRDHRLEALEPGSGPGAV